MQIPPKVYSLSLEEVELICIPVSLYLVIKLKVIQFCLQMHSSGEKIQDITNALISELSALCQCQLTSEIFDEERLICFHESSNSVTFQARISGTADMDSETFVALIEDWVATKPTIHVLGVLLRVHNDCDGVEQWCVL